MQHNHQYHKQLLVAQEYKPLLLLDGLLLFRGLWLIIEWVLEHKSENVQRSWQVIFKGNLNIFKISIA